MFNGSSSRTTCARFRRPKEYYLRKNPNGKIQFHSCGAIAEPFMRGLMECGVDGSDSLPPKVARHSNPAAKKRLLGKEMFFYGGIDVQETLPWGIDGSGARRGPRADLGDGQRGRLPTQQLAPARA